jgi:hypothetical protein
MTQAVHVSWQLSTLQNLCYETRFMAAQHTSELVLWNTFHGRTVRCRTCVTIHVSWQLNIFLNLFYETRFMAFEYISELVLRNTFHGSLACY